MDENTLEESSKDKKRKESKLNFDKRFIAVAVFLVISIISFSFASRYLFEVNIEGWTIPLGYFELEDRSIGAKHFENNIAIHQSNVSYGLWEWEVRYYGAGSASVIFAGLHPIYSSYNLCSEGYKLQFEIGKPLALFGLDGLGLKTELNSTYFVPEANERYQIRIIRNTDNIFYIYINGQLKITAFDSTFIVSNYFQLAWFNVQTLYWVDVNDYVGENSWSDHFTGLPSSSSNNIFTKISLYLPYAAILLVLIFYIFRLLFSEGNWTRFLVPLLISLVIGLGYGFLARYIRNNMPEFVPDTLDPYSSISTNVTGTDTAPTLPSEPSSDPTSGNNGTSNIPVDGFTGIPPKVISVALLGVAGVFIIVAVIFIGIDFFRRRDDEFHERIIDKDKRWIPTATSSDHRKRVIRAYHKASYDLIDRGVKSERSMTPGEFEKSTEEKFPDTDEKITSLTDLYEEARFSEHEINSEDSEKAEEYCNSISSAIHPFKEEKDTSDVKEENEEDKKGEGKDE
ncbi:MAG: DUF4129 domain-containing protein [Asgard group archaeon]|nr:DUF4129 domain-containing protein [Asgard group archaeon]